MKVSTMKPEFQPVVITLETQEEVDQLFQLAQTNEFPGSDDITYQIYDLLKDLISDDTYATSDDVCLIHKKDN